MTHCIYFISASSGVGPIKVWISSRPIRRLDAIRSCSPVPLVMIASMPGDREIEQALHTRYAPHRSHGEWFNRHPEIMQDIEDVKRGAFDHAILPQPVFILPKRQDFAAILMAEDILCGRTKYELA